MPPPFASAEGKATAYSLVGAAANVNSSAPENLSKRKQQRNAQLDDATSYFESDSTFKDLQTGPGPNGRIYRWLKAQLGQMESYRKFLSSRGTMEQWNENASKTPGMLKSSEIKSLSPMLEAFANRSGSRKSKNMKAKKFKKPILVDSQFANGMVAPRPQSFPSHALMLRTNKKEKSNVARRVCRNECNQELFDGITELATYRSVIGEVRNCLDYSATGAMWKQVALQILSVRVSVLLSACSFESISLILFVML